LLYNGRSAEILDAFKHDLKAEVFDIACGIGELQSRLQIIYIYQWHGHAWTSDKAGGHCEHFRVISFSSPGAVKIAALFSTCIFLTAFVDVLFVLCFISNF